MRVSMEQMKMSAISDERVDFLREQAFTILRLKTDKWNRFIGLEENQSALLDFFDQGWREYIILFVGPGGTLHAGDEQVSISNTLIHTHLQCSDLQKIQSPSLCSQCGVRIPFLLQVSLMFNALIGFWFSK